ncbi:MAG: hypothetical protein IPM61_04430 [Chlorobi bacterium]|nr:hypothetical protein [Chlorobiota bacterium]
MHQPATLHSGFLRHRCVWLVPAECLRNLLYHNDRHGNRRLARTTPSIWPRHALPPIHLPRAPSGQHAATWQSDF